MYFDNSNPMISTNNRIFILVILILIFAQANVAKDRNDRERRYIFYDVNMGEGFNLRRDVFMRVAVFVKNLNLKSKSYHYTLVLPPWGRLYHWQSRHLGEQVRIPWKTFFDVESINRYVPVMELEDYLKQEGNIIDTVYYLQNYAEGWKDGKFEEKHDFRECIDRPRYHKEGELWNGYFWDYGYGGGEFDAIKTRDFKCLSVQGSTYVIHDLVEETKGRSIMLDRAENLLHDRFGDTEYWGVRRSMRFASHLVDIANGFRKENLGSSDKKDDTRMTERWEDFQPKRSETRGGPYMCVHLRRKDYVRAREGQIPSLKGAAEQIKRKLDDLRAKDSKLEPTVFISSDAPKSEYEELKKSLKKTDVEAFRYVPTDEIHKKYMDGGVAIIDQSICSHARFFLGSYESTFTFRIQEEREILGFPTKKTFEMLCADGKFDCERGSVWKIEYGDFNRDKDEL